MSRTLRRDVIRFECRESSLSESERKLGTLGFSFSAYDESAQMIEYVLLVDDDPDIRLVGELALGSVGGWRTAVASSGKEGVELALADRPDLILLDVMMPQFDGPATLEALRKNEATADIPVIFCTAQVQRHEVDYLRSLGAIGVISKPFNPMKLAADVEAILAKSDQTIRVDRP